MGDGDWAGPGSPGRGDIWAFFTRSSSRRPCRHPRISPGAKDLYSCLLTHGLRHGLKDGARFAGFEYR